MKKKKLGEVLYDRGKISSEDLLMMIAEQQGKVIHLGELMLERGLVEKDDLAAALEEVSRVPYLDCGEVVPDPKALKLIQRAMAERCSALPIRIEHGRLVAAMAAPQDLAVLDELRNANRPHGHAWHPRSHAIRRNRIRLRQLPADQSRGHSGNAGRSTTEKNARGDIGLGNHSKGDGEIRQRYSHRTERFTSNREPRRPRCGFAWTVCCVIFSPSRGTCKLR